MLQKRKQNANYMLFMLAYLKLLENALQGNLHLERLFEGIKLKIMTAAFLLDMANKMMHHICYTEVW